MWPRKKLDISWHDLAYGAWKCCSKSNADVELPAPWADRRILPCLSVRTGFDLLLQSLKLPHGSEVLLSGLSIPDMAKLVRAHGLVPVPVDIDLATLGPSGGSIESHVNASSRMLVIAHLFGSRLRMTPFVELARRRNLVLVEDCAQAYYGAEYIGHDEADASLFSFGPIKTATALGGALIRLRDQQTLGEMQRLQAQFPLQSRRSYAARIAKYSLLKLVSHPWLFGALHGACRLAGRDPDRLINSLARNFGRGELLSRIRRQPCQPLLSLLEKRLRDDGAAQVEHRAAWGRSLAESLDSFVDMPGRRAADHTHWIFPVVSERPDELVATLRDAGFDATRCHNLAALADSPEATPAIARLLRDMVLLPLYIEMPDSELRRMADVVQRFAMREQRGEMPHAEAQRRGGFAAMGPQRLGGSA